MSRADSSHTAASLTERTFDWLTNQLMTGALRPGQWVSENELAERFGVSRSPVREALRRLEADRLVEVRPRRGTIILELDPREMIELYEVRALLDGEVVARVADTFDPTEAHALLDCLARLRTARAVPDFFDVLHEFYSRLYDLVGHGPLRDVAQTLWRRSLRTQSMLLSMPGRDERVVSGLEELCARFGLRDRNGARHVIEQLYEDTRDVIREASQFSLGGAIRPASSVSEETTGSPIT